MCIKNSIKHYRKSPYIDAVENEKKISSFDLFLTRVKTRAFLANEKRKAYKAKDRDKVGTLSYLMKVNLDNFSFDEVKKLANENLYDLSNEYIVDN